MKIRARWSAALALVVAIAAVSWTMRSAVPPVADQTPAVAPTRAAPSVAAPAPKAKTTPRVSDAAHSPAPKHALPDWRTPFGEAVQTLLEYAEAGDTDAAVELSWRLSGCTDRALSRSEESEQWLRRSRESEDKEEGFTKEQHAARMENLERQADEYASQREACRALPADLRAGWLGWIDRAAQSGNTAAMRGYARVATAEYYDANDVRNDLDAAIERRDKSRAYLDEALRRGDAEALRDLANAYRDSGHPTIYPLDPAKAYAYAYAGTLAGISRGNDLDRTMEETTRLLDAQQLSEAEAAGRLIYEKCCHPR